MPTDGLTDTMIPIHPQPSFAREGGGGGRTNSITQSL